MTRMPADDPRLPAAANAGEDRDPEADQGQRVRRQADPAEGEGDRDGEAADAGPRLGLMTIEPGHDATVACRRRWRRVVDAEDGRLAALERGERLRAEAADRLAACPPRPDEARRRGAARDATRRGAATGRPGRRAPPRSHRRGRGADDPQAVDVRQGLVHDAQLAQLVRLEDGVGDRAADAGAGWGSGRVLRRGGARRRINGGLYQWWLILGARGARCQDRRGAGDGRETAVG